MTNFNQEIDNLKKDIETVSKKEVCQCGKTLFYYDDKYIYIKCRQCKIVHKFKLPL